MNHYAVHLKLTQHCKSTILQYKIKIFFKKGLCRGGGRGCAGVRPGLRGLIKDFI